MYICMYIWKYDPKHCLFTTLVKQVALKKNFISYKRFSCYESTTS